MALDAIAEVKRAARAEARQRLKTMTPEARAEGSRRVCEAVINWPVFAAAKVIGLYVALPDEVDVRVLGGVAAEAGRVVAIPRVRWDTHELTFARCTMGLDGGVQEAELVLARLGLREPPAGAEPVPSGSIDLLIVPGLAFDRAGGRLGRGKGFYDRLLGGDERPRIACGVAFEEQLVDAVPMAGHDRRLDALVTPSGLVWGSGAERGPA